MQFPNNIDPKTFFNEVAKTVDEFQISYLDAIVHICESNNIELEVAASLIKGNSKIKTTLQHDCIQLRYLKKE